MYFVDKRPYSYIYIILQRRHSTGTYANQDFIYRKHLYVPYISQRSTLTYNIVTLFGQALILQVSQD